MKYQKRGKTCDVQRKICGQATAKNTKKKKADELQREGGELRKTL